MNRTNLGNSNTFVTTGLSFSFSFSFLLCLCVLASSQITVLVFAVYFGYLNLLPGDEEKQSENSLSSNLVPFSHLVGVCVMFT